MIKLNQTKPISSHDPLLHDHVGVTHQWQVTEVMQAWVLRECTACKTAVFSRPESSSVQMYGESIWETCIDAQAREIQES